MLCRTCAEEVRIASMRPRLLGRGNLCGAMRPPPGRFRFNEAAAVRPRKRKARFPPADLIPSFNEAAAVRPRKLGNHLFPGFFFRASMRPRLLGRGNGKCDIHRRAVGRASMRPRLLGRGNGAEARDIAARRRASMRPRLLGRGNEKMKRVKCAGCHELQ